LAKISLFFLPKDHIINQNALIDIAHACYQTGLKDDNIRAKQSYGFGLILENLINHHMVTKDALNQWFNDMEISQKCPDEVMEQVKNVIQAHKDDEDVDDDINSDNNNDDDDDSDSD